MSATVTEDADGGKVRQLHPQASKIHHLPDGIRRVPGSAGYLFAPSGIYKTGKSGGGGDEEDNSSQSPLLDWCPEVTERGATLAEPGAPARRYYMIRVGEDEATVMHWDLRSGECWDQFPDAVGVGSRTVRDVLANVVQALARDLPRTVALERTGWHQVSGRTVYVFEDGRTIPGGVHVRLVGMPDKAAKAVTLPARWAPRAELADALAVMSAHGWGLLYGVGTGVRALAQSVHRIPAGAAFIGPPGSGKDSAAWAAQAVRCNPGWPPRTMGSFGDTKTDIEAKADRARDQIGLITDLALTLDAPAIEQRDAKDKLEALFRPMFNDTVVRGRRKQDMSAGRGNEIQCYPIITAQRLPQSLQESLYRRFIAVYFEYGDNDVSWYGAKDDTGAYVNSARLILPLRTIGQRFLEMLAAADDPRGMLAQNDAEALRALTPFVDEALPGWADRDDCFREVVKSAAAMAGGLAFAADIAGLPDRWALFRVIAPKLAASLARQADVMEDRQAASDDMSTAVGEVISRALLGRDAHMRDSSGAVAPCVPGLTEQEQGIRDLGDHGWSADGVPFYYLPDHGGVGVASSPLHGLLKSSRDDRVAQGYTSRALPAALLKHGVIVPSAQKDRAASHLIRVGSGPKRLLILRSDVIWPDLGNGYGEFAEKNGYSGYSGYTPGQGPSVPGGADSNGNAVTSTVTAVTAVTVLGDQSLHDVIPAPEETTVPTCSVCHETMTVIMAGQTTHPMCEGWEEGTAGAASNGAERKPATPAPPIVTPVPAELARGSWLAEQRGRGQFRPAGQEAFEQALAVLDDPGISEHPERLRLLAALEGEHKNHGPFAPYRSKRGPYWSAPMPAVSDGPRISAPNWAREDYHGPVVVLDRNAAWPSAASSVSVVHGAFQNTGPQDEEAPVRPGYYVVTAYPWTETGMPSPLGSVTPGEKVTVPGPRMTLLRELAKAGRWPDGGAADSWTGDPCRLDGWAHLYGELRRYALDVYGRESAQYDALKVAFGQTMGLLRGSWDRSSAVPRKTWKCKARRPDWQHAIEDQAAVTLWRAADECQTLAGADLGPVAIRNVDELVIPAAALGTVTGQQLPGRNRPPVRLDPGGVRFGTFKIKGREEA